MTEVIKKDGRREPFDVAKLRRSIETAAREAGIPEERAREVVDRVASIAIEMAEKETEIESGAIRERVLSELDSIEPAVSQAWRNYDQNKPAKL